MLLINGIFLSNILLIILVFLFGLFLSFNFSRNKSSDLSISFKSFNFLFLFKILIFINLFLCSYGFINFYLFNSGRVIDIRNVYYNSGSVFNSTYIYTFYEIFSTPLTVIALPYFINSNFKNKKLFIILTLIFLLCDAFLKQGRFQFLFLLLFLSYYTNLFLNKKLFIPVVLFLFFGSFYIFINRQIPNFNILNLITSNNIDFDYLNKYTINYQFYGYLILNKSINTSFPFGNPFEFNTISFIFYILNTFIFSKFLGIKLEYPWELYNHNLSSIDVYVKEFSININAFSTNFYPLFLDGGYLYIFIFGLISGLIIGLTSDSKFVKILKFLNFYILIFGLYQPVITFFVGFVFQIMVLIFLYFTIKNNIQFNRNIYKS